MSFSNLNTTKQKLKFFRKTWKQAKRNSFKIKNRF